MATALALSWLSTMSLLHIFLIRWLHQGT